MLKSLVRCIAACLFVLAPFMFGTGIWLGTESDRLRAQFHKACAIHLYDAAYSYDINTSIAELRTAVAYLERTADLASLTIAATADGETQPFALTTLRGRILTHTDPIADHHNSCVPLGHLPAWDRPHLIDGLQTLNAIPTPRSAGIFYSTP